MKQLPVDLGDLALAFESDRARFDYVFDLETGETIMVTQETHSLAEERYKRAAEDDPEAAPDLPVLLDHEPERQRWFGFQNARMERRVVEWLETHGIEPVVEGKTE